MGESRGSRCLGGCSRRGGSGERSRGGFGERALPVRLGFWLPERLGNFLWELYPKYCSCAISQEGSDGLFVLCRLPQPFVCADLLDEQHGFKKRCEAGS